MVLHNRESSLANMAVSNLKRSRTVPNCSRGRAIGESHVDRAFRSHDLRRTCAKLCRKNGGDLEQIKFLLGHASIQTTERYLGSEQEIAVAVNDNLGL
jgi:integrase